MCAVVQSGAPPAAEAPSARPRGWTFALAWLPVWALWSSALVVVGVAWPVALREGAVTIGAAALLGIGAWRLAARLRWPERVRWRFFVGHLLLAVVYALAWRVTAYGVAALRFGDAFPSNLLTSPTLAWELVMGAWLYGLIVGAFYILEARELLRRAALRAARGEALALEARLDALSAQLDPHFLFNALHSIGALVRRDPAAAERALELLGGMLRHSLDRDRRELVELRDEWRFTRDYLELQKLRFGDRLEVESALSPEALAELVPPFLLQPLVENAVVHGLGERPAGGRLRIEACRREGELQVMVADDGVGADPHRVDRAEGRGLGILRQRLAAHFGERQRLTVDTTPGQGFTVRVRIAGASP